MSDPRFFRKYLDILGEEDEALPQVQPDPSIPTTEPHPLAKGLGFIRMLNNLKNIRASTVKNAISQGISNVARSSQDPSSKNVITGPDTDQENK